MNKSLFFALSALTVVGRPLVAQTGLLVVAHGADSSWNERVRQTVAQVRWDAGPMRLAFLMGVEAGTASFDRRAGELGANGAQRIVVVPLMVSSFGSHVADIERAAAHAAAPAMPLGATGHTMAMTTTVAVPMRVTAALDSASELGEALTARWWELPARDRTRALVLVAHGPNDDADAARWVANITAASGVLAGLLPDRAIHVGLLRDDAPPEVRARAVAGIRDTITSLYGQRHDSVLVMTVLISSGSINSTVVPCDLAGMPMRYVGAALAPNAALARWIERVASAVRW